MNILFLAAEVSPYASTGGLGEVIGSLPLALQKLNINCRVLIPAYASVDLPRITLQEWQIPFDGQSIPVALQQATGTELPLYFLDVGSYFQGDQLYGSHDDIVRFGAFCRAALLAQKYFEEHDWPVHVIHCHDWHTALFAVYKSTFTAPGKVLLTIHNLAYQGLCDAVFLERLDLPLSLYNWQQLEFWGKLNPFKGGLVFADAISTVSPTYAKEIQTPEHGCGLEGVLHERRSKLFGILNGINQGIWNPQKDIYLKTLFSSADVSGKQRCKTHLQKIGGLQPDLGAPLVGMVTRLTEQKGIDVLLTALDGLMDLGIQLIVLGDGEPALQTALKNVGKRYAGRVSVNVGIFDPTLAHQIYAGSDLFLMPSRFEPCGLAQMISMRYGTIPIVHATGGLADTVRYFPNSSGAGNGFVFHSLEPDALIDATRQATLCFQTDSWATIQQNAFKTDFSWGKSAQDYANVYRALVERSRPVVIN